MRRHNFYTCTLLHFTAFVFSFLLFIFYNFYAFAFMLLHLCCDKQDLCWRSCVAVISKAASTNTCLVGIHRRTVPNLPCRLHLYFFFAFVFVFVLYISEYSLSWYSQKPKSKPADPFLYLCFMFVICNHIVFIVLVLFTKPVVVFVHICDCTYLSKYLPFGIHRRGSSKSAFSLIVLLPKICTMHPLCTQIRRCMYNSDIF